MNFKKQKLAGGFTLIELLTVIGIIAILASVVMVMLGSARQNSRIAAGKQFEANIIHGIGDQMVAEYKLNTDPGAARKALDTSSYNNHGSLGSSVSFNATGGYSGGGAYNFVSLYDGNSIISLGNNPRLSLGNGDFAISAWVKYTSVTDYSTILWESNGYGTGVTTGNVIHFGIFPNTNKLYLGFYGLNNLGNKAVPSNSWTHVAVSFISATKKASFYINGTLDATITTDVSPSFTGITCAQIGTRYCGGIWSDFGGLMNNVRLYSSAITTAQINKLYAEGLKTHQDLAVK